MNQPPRRYMRKPGQKDPRTKCGPEDVKRWREKLRAGMKKYQIQAQEKIGETTMNKYMEIY